MSAVRILHTTASDIPALIPFINDSWVRTYAPLIGADKAKELAIAKHKPNLFQREISVSDAVSWLAKSENIIVGHVAGFKTNNGKLYIDRFHVAPEWHGKNVATGLADAAAEDALNKGFQFLELTVLQGNERALAFYQKQGFEVDWSRSPTDGLGPKKALTMVKSIAERSDK